MQGLITIRRGPGGGPIVGHLDPASLGRTSTLYYHLAGGTYGELFEAWVVTESILAERAARNPDREAVRAAMEPYFDETRRHDDDGVGRLRRRRTPTSTASWRRWPRTACSRSCSRPSGQIVTHHVVVNADPREERDVIDHDHAGWPAPLLPGAPTRPAQAMAEHISHMVSYYQGRVGDQLHDYIDWR